MIKPGDYVVRRDNEMEVMELVGDTVYCRAINGIELHFPLEKVCLSRIEEVPLQELQSTPRKRGRAFGSKNKRKPQTIKV